jgi:Raf kinase inhibitor-like YbhB/YbcL family protein
MKTVIRIAAAVLAMAFTVNQASAQFVLPDMRVTSNAFADGAVIPIKYTSHGENVQPDFTITGAPEGTVSYAIIMHDIEVALAPNTGDVTHWVAFNIPSANIAEGSLPEGSLTGNNITGQPTYMGSGAPMRERFHHYVWEFYALNANLDLPAGATRDQVMEAMAGKVTAKAAYVGKYADARPAQ